MIKNRLKHNILVAILLIGCGFVSCSDVDDVVDPTFDRLLSPTNLEARIVNRTNVRLIWTLNKQAESYNIAIYEGSNFDAAPTVSLSGITESPYLIENILQGETTYTARIQAVGSAINDSKWSDITFSTDAEHILYAPGSDDIQATQVTLRWPAGYTATHIAITPGNIHYTVTSSDIQKGEATVKGLTGETEYTAKLMNNDKVRGTLTFTTPVDVGNATIVSPEDDLVALIGASEDGEVFALMPGEYTIESDVEIKHTIGIKAAKPAEKTTLKGMVLRMKTGAGLELGGIIFDGTGSKDGNQMIVYDEAGTNPALIIENCEIKNYTKGTLYVNQATRIASVTIKGCTYSNIECSGGDFIDFRNGLTPSFEFTGNTAYNSALARDFFRMDAGGSTNFPDVKSILKITNNTFYNVSNGNNRRILYVRLANHEITFNKNILAATEGYYTNQAATTLTEMTDNNYYNAPNFTASEQSNAQNDTGKYYTLNPGFKDAANGDFTVSDEDLIVYGIGDPRWLSK